MRCGGSQRTVWPEESVSGVLPHNGLNSLCHSIHRVISFTVYSKAGADERQDSLENGNNL